MKRILPLILLSLMFAFRCSANYSEINKQQLKDVFTLNSSPTFNGHYYQGSDESFHYFVSRWKLKKDKKYKIKKDILGLAEVFEFGFQEIQLTAMNLPESSSVFFRTEETIVYIMNNKTGSNKAAERNSE